MMGVVRAFVDSLVTQEKMSVALVLKIIFSQFSDGSKSTIHLLKFDNNNGILCIIKKKYFVTKSNQ